MSFVTQETNNEVRRNVYKRSTFKNRWHQGFRSSLRKILFENEISLMFPDVGKNLDFYEVSQGVAKFLSDPERKDKCFVVEYSH